MARGYNTADRQFVDDFIFQPNMELASLVLDKKDKEIQDVYDKAQLLNNIPIEHWAEADRQNVANIQQNYTQKVEELTKKLVANPMDNGLKLELNRLQNELTKDFTTGDISKVIRNNEMKKKFDADLAKLDTAAQEKYKAYVVDNYLNTVGEKGALQSVLQYDPMTSTRELRNDFLSSESFKSIPEQSKEDVKGWLAGGWKTETAKSFTERTGTDITSAMNAFLQQEDVQHYVKDRDKIDGGSWLDSSGNVSLEKGTKLYNQLFDVADTYSYKNTTSKYDRDAGADWQYQWGYMGGDDTKVYEGTEIEERALAMTPQNQRLKDDIGKKIFQTSMDYMKNHDNGKYQEFLRYQKQDPAAALRWLRKYNDRKVEEGGDYGQTIEMIRSVEKANTMSGAASVSTLFKGDPARTENFMNNYTSTENSLVLNNEKMTISIDGADSFDVWEDGKKVTKYTDKGFLDMSPQSLQHLEKITINGKKYKPFSSTVIPKSQLPSVQYVIDKKTGEPVVNSVGGAAQIELKLYPWDGKDWDYEKPITKLVTGAYSDSKIVPDWGTEE